jgi:hypothetical protein
VAALQAVAGPSLVRNCTVSASAANQAVVAISVAHAGLTEIPGFRVLPQRLRAKPETRKEADARSSTAIPRRVNAFPGAVRFNTSA